MHQNEVRCDLSLHGYFCTIFVYHRLSLHLNVCICIYTIYRWTSTNKYFMGKKLKDIWSWSKVACTDTTVLHFAL